jgi:hypothetical protein
MLVGVKHLEVYMLAFIHCPLIHADDNRREKGQVPMPMLVHMPAA